MLKLTGIPGAIFGLCVIRPQRYLTVSVDRPNPTLNPKPLNETPPRKALPGRPFPTAVDMAPWALQGLGFRV